MREQGLQTRSKLQTFGSSENYRLINYLVSRKLAVMDGLFNFMGTL